MFHLGCDYYPEHWPESRWAEDARTMRAAGLDVVRIGEFAWARMEPGEGRFDWDWLDQAIDTLAAEGLHVVLGTPTAAPPAWLSKACPDTLPVDAAGRTRRPGSRRHYCPTSPTYGRHSDRIVQALAERYGQHPAVIGWQIDNEFGCHDTARCYCDQCAAAFRAWLKQKYGSLAALNEAWGAVFWSQTYSDWGEIALPNLTVADPNPSHVLDYYRFASAATVAYQQRQINLLRHYTDGQFVTTNIIGNLPDLDYHDLARPLDFISWDSYPSGYAEMQEAAFYGPDERPRAFAYDVGDPYITGFCHALTRGLKQAPFWVMEQQCGHINWSRSNTTIRPGAVRLWTWHALTEGADVVVYFRWRAARFGLEQHHSGLLRHDASPATGYNDVLAMQAERAAMNAVATGPVAPQVALLLDYNDLWAIQLQPHRHGFSTMRHLFRFYRALQRLGIPTDIVAKDADLNRYKLVIAPTVFLADDNLTATLGSYVTSGGALLLGVRSGFKTLTNLVADQPLPGPFRKLVGATVSAWGSLPPGVGFELASEIVGLAGRAGFWAEALTPDPDTVTLARYADGPYASAAALTTHPVGDGKVLYLGWYPTEAQAAAILARLANEAGITPVAEALPEGVVATRRGPHTVLLNFTKTSQTVSVAGGAVTVGSRDVVTLG